MEEEWTAITRQSEEESAPRNGVLDGTGRNGSRNMNLGRIKMVDDWECPHCGSSKGTWFDRSAMLDGEGNEVKYETFPDRCEDCGKNVAAPPSYYEDCEPYVKGAHTYDDAIAVLKKFGTDAGKQAKGFSDVYGKFIENMSEVFVTYLEEFRDETLRVRKELDAQKE